MPRRKVADCSIEGRHVQVNWRRDNRDYIQLSTHGRYGPDLLNGDRVNLDESGLDDLIKVLKKVRRKVFRRR